MITPLRSPHLLAGSSPIHGTGLFAKTEIPRGFRLIEYTGEKIDKGESSRRRKLNNEFIFHLDESWDLDGNVPTNPARFINHSCAPNCEAEMIDGRIWISALRDIQAGEEITFNYGYDLDEFQKHPCSCGAPECIGFIVADIFFADVRRRMA